MVIGNIIDFPANKYTSLSFKYKKCELVEQEVMFKKC